MASQRELSETLKGKQWPPRIDQHSAGYMEFEEARKDGKCKIVHVNGGLSKELGCCNLFEPEDKDTKKFSCGTCKYLHRKD